MSDQRTKGRAAKSRPAARKSTGGQFDRLAEELAEKAADLERRERAFGARLRRVERIVVPVEAEGPEPEGDFEGFGVDRGEPARPGLRLATEQLAKAIDAHGDALRELEDALVPVLRPADDPPMLAGMAISDSRSAAVDGVDDLRGRVDGQTERIARLLNQLDL